MQTLTLSRHAAVRTQQRGMPHHLLHAFLDHADIDAPAGGHCRLLRISRERLRDRSVREELGADADRLARLAVIWSSETGTIVTVMHQHAGGAGRRYRATH